MCVHASDLSARTVQEQKAAQPAAASPAGPPAPAKAEDIAAARPVLDRFFVALGQKDLDGMMACWDEGSEGYARFKEWIGRVLSGPASVRVADLNFSRWQAEDTRLKTRARFVLKWRDPASGQSEDETVFWNLSLAQVKGPWRIAARESPGQELVWAFLRAEKPEDRQRLLEEESELVTPAQIISLLDTARNYAREDKVDSYITIDVMVGIVFPASSKPRASKYNQARALIGGAAEMARFLGDKRLQGWAYGYEANTYSAEGKRADQMQAYERALPLFREAGEKRGEATALNGMGFVLLATGRYAESLAKLREALQFARDSQQGDVEASVLDNLGVAQIGLGNYAEALPLFQEALEICRRAKFQRVEMEILVDLGDFYRAVGRYEEARSTYLQGIQLAEELKDEVQGALALRGLGDVEQLTDHPQEALDAYRKSAIVFALYERESALIPLLNQSAAIYTALGKYRNAETALEHNLKLARKAGDRAGEAEALIRQGEVRRLSGKQDEARPLYDQALRIGQETGDTLHSLKAASGIGDLHRARKEWPQAAQAYRQAIENIEWLRAQSREQSLQTSLFHQFTAPYFNLAVSLVESGAPLEEAFRIGEQAKSRTLVQMLEGGKVNVRKAMTDVERQEEQKIEAQVTALSVQLAEAQTQSHATRPMLADLNQRLQQARAASESFRRRLFLAHPELQVQRARFEPATLEQLNRTLFATTPRLALLSYLVGEEETLAFVITRAHPASATARITLHRIPVSRRELTERVERFRRQCARVSGTTRGVIVRDDSAAGDYRAEARALYSLLVEPARAELSGRTHVVILPDGMLNAFPFQALMPASGKHWIETQAISYAPSATVLEKMVTLSVTPRGGSDAASGGGAAMLAVGRPNFGGGLNDLPATEDEVKAIAPLFGGTPLLGDAATKLRVKAEAERPRYLHLATHGLLNQAAPMYSAIALTRGANDDGMLYAHELLDMNLRANLVVLSACETALGQQTRGEGVLGLTWALFVAGAPSTLVTQWSVDDRSTGELMVEFYKRLSASKKGGRQNKAESLRQAQLRLMKDGVHSHPYYWAPFVLIGAWQE